MPRKTTLPAPELAPTKDEEWGANDTRAALRTVRFDPNLVDVIRAKAGDKLHNVAGDPLGDEEAALVPIMLDGYFRGRWGAGLEFAGPEMVVRLALDQLLRAVHEAPPGRTGVREIDDSRSFKSVGDMLKYVRRDET